MQIRRDAGEFAEMLHDFREVLSESRENNLKLGGRGETTPED